MAESAQEQQQDVKVLFKKWRSGDPDAGIQMAQRFSDWYYAITVMRLGDQRARAPLESACQLFAQRIMEVTNAEDLIDFAHHIVLEELRSAGADSPGGDFPNNITQQQSPSALLSQVSASLSPEQIHLLHLTYTGQGDIMDIDQSMPFSALEARHALKHALHQTGIQFAILPTEPDMDRAPMPLYESRRLASPEEERCFEQWLLTNHDLCTDIAQFSSFAHALRAGALRDVHSETGAATPQQTRASSTAAPASPSTLPPPPAKPAEPSSKLPLFIGGGILVGLLIAAALFMG
jgi:hypothetical protein